MLIAQRDRYSIQKIINYLFILESGPLQKIYATKKSSLLISRELKHYDNKHNLDGGVSGSGELQKGTNDKRVLSSGTESDLESRKEQLSFDDCSKQQALSGPGQPFSVSTLERLLSRGKTLPPQGLHARSGEHEVYAMFGRSPGLPGKHLREEVISLEDVAEVSGIPLPDSKRPENEEPTDSYVRLFSGVGKAVVWQSTYTNPRLGPQSLTSLNAGK
jgi:hypothetical protein